MVKLLFWVGVAVMAAVLASFAVSNRTPAALGLWPLPFILDVPLYLAILGALLIGFVFGALSGWIAGGRRRRRARHSRRRLAAVERELATVRAQLPEAEDRLPAARERLPARG